MPYKPASEETVSDDVQIPSGEVLLVTAGPRELIEEASEAISSEAARIEIVDPIVFRDVAFPDGDWRVSRLLMQGNGRRIFDELGVKYVVLLGKLEESTSDEHGDVIIYIGFYGAASAKMEAKLSAIVFDLRNERLLYDISSKAVGTAGGLGFFYGLFVVPDSEASAVEGLGEKIAATLLEETESGRLSIAVMALEPKIWLEDTEDTEDYETNLPLAGMVREKSAPAPPPDMAAVRERLRKSAEDGDPASQWLLYADYGYRDQDWVWLCEAADQEYGDAMVEVGNILWEGRGGIARDRELARCWYKAAFDAGHGDAKSELMAAEWMLSGDQAASTGDHCTGKHLPSCEETLLSRETP